MTDIELVLRAIMFIEEHLNEDVGVSDIASNVCTSLFHFSRIFSRYTRVPPYHYLMCRRLSEAANSLLGTDKKIIDISCAYQFKAPETFSRVFKRRFHLTPSQLRKNKLLDKRYLMPRMSPDYLEFINSEISLKPEIIQMPLLNLAGLAVQIEERAINPPEWIWDSLRSEIKCAFGNHVRNVYGARMIFPEQPDYPIMYLAAIHLEDMVSVPVKFVQKLFSEMEVVRFKVPQQERALEHMRAYVYHTWWPKAAGDRCMPDLEIEQFPEEQEANVSGNCLPNFICFPFSRAI
ncbi:MAG: helix-turn-helix transcriptional regulator [Anaerolineaceae bacterium]|nr:helix-turn-helix transcriptional regulator [Anaerolineaceae bacterium]